MLNPPAASSPIRGGTRPGAGRRRHRCSRTPPAPATQPSPTTRRRPATRSRSRRTAASTTSALPTGTGWLGSTLVRTSTAALRRSSTLAWLILRERWHDRAAAQPRKVAVVMSRFPKLTETFVLEEVRALERQGSNVVLYPLHREPCRRSSTRPRHGGSRGPATCRWCRGRSPRSHALVSPPPAAAAISAPCWPRWRAHGGVVASSLGALGMLPKVVHASRLMVGEGVDHVHCHFASHPRWLGSSCTASRASRSASPPTGPTSTRTGTCSPRRSDEAAFVVAISEHNRCAHRRRVRARRSPATSTSCGAASTPPRFAPAPEPPGPDDRAAATSSPSARFTR